MTETMLPEAKKAEYRIKKFIDALPSGRLTDEKTALAAQMDISIAQLNRIIRGDSEPNGSQLRIIADFFGVSVDELYSKDAPELAVQIA